MPRLLPQLVAEPPPGYVAFVADHLRPLRREAAEIVGDDRYADCLYPEVLTDLAMRWRRLELLRRYLGRRGAAERYLHRALARRSAQWHTDRLTGESLTSVQIEVVVGQDLWQNSWQGSWQDNEPPARRAAPSRRVSLAERLGSHLRSADTEPGPLAEAAIAWWHAYEMWRRRRTIAGLVIAIIVSAVLSTMLERAG